jgi:uncharacterized protein involved in response to NO
LFHRNKIAVCMFLLQGLLLLAMWQEWKDNSHVKTPVLVALVVSTFLYSIGCSVFPDSEREKSDQKTK